MIERPILFSGPMVRAILDGRKTVTRRLIRPNPYDGAFYVFDGWPHRSTDGQGNRVLGMEEPYRSPYGRPGDRLWVRETWRGANGWRPENGHLIEYGADSRREYREAPEKVLPYQFARKKWRPSIHMPRWASRLTLEVTEVRVERLQDITPTEAQAEGLSFTGPTPPTDVARIGAFAELWDSINGERKGAAWALNPWVWVVGFAPVLP